jgi:ATP:ADP antiporter, AAA family
VTRERRREIAFAGLMGLLFFLVVTTFWVMKPLKKGLLIRTYDTAGLTLGGTTLSAPQAEQLAKVANVVVATLAAVAFARASRTLRRHRLVLAVAAAFLVGHATFAWLLVAPSPPSVWAFYLYGDLWSTVMVASFFAFLNDSVSPEVAKRLYGPIGLGGVAGGVVGASVVAGLLGRLDLPTWMALCIAATLAIAALAWAAGNVTPGTGTAGGGRKTARGRASSPVAVVAHSRYLLAIVAMVALYEIVSTLLDFQFTTVVSRKLDGPAIDGQFARVFAVTNAASLAIQLVATPLVLTRLGVGPALLALPGAALLAQTAFAAAPGLWTGSALSVSDNALNYSIQQSARETLYVPIRPEEKYQAKAVIDMFVQRLAKTVAIGVGLGLTLAVGSEAGLRWMALPVAAVLVVWIACARYAGRRFRELAGKAGR